MRRGFNQLLAIAIAPTPYATALSCVQTRAEITQGNHDGNKHGGKDAMTIISLSTITEEREREYRAELEELEKPR